MHTGKQMNIHKNEKDNNYPYPQTKKNYNKNQLV